MEQYRYLDSAMVAENHFKNGANLRIRMSRRNIIISIEGILLMFFFLLTSCSQPTPIDVSSDNLEDNVSIEVNKHLDRAVKLNAIAQYQREPVQTSIESFKSVAQKYAADGATLHPNLTYKIKYWKISGEKECDAIAYSVVKDGKLYGSGVVFSEAVDRAWASTWAMGDNIKDTGINWPVWIGFILLMLMTPFLIRLYTRLRFPNHNPIGNFGSAAFLEDLGNAQNGNVKAMVNVGLAYWRGDGVTRNLYEAERWLRRAAALGDPNARGMLLRMFANPNNSF